MPASAPAASRLFVLPVATRRWVLTDNTTIANVSDEDVIHYFHDGITTQSLYRDFGRNCPKMVVEL